MNIGAKAVAKEGHHSFKIGEVITFVGMVSMFYSKEEEIYDFNNGEISQHLSKEEFELIK